ncbi:uncharacterized protein LOC129945299 [Eupeodes corollae]|uniref:uncharacterized protein LOC129945299 n=1 Tax=Eupeodes corollae TaxID=290404 RepID=UPI00248FD023|nr:uncharacterized protein LOC129945299 [Eupeodes corollae]
MAPMVECGTCFNWFHFPCVGVTEEVESIDWHCGECVSKLQAIQDSTSKEKSTTNAAASGVEVQPSSQDDSVDDHTPVKGLCKPVEKAKHNKKATRSNGSIATKASSANRVKLQLQKLEEERKLQAKRDKEYIDKKYAILEQCSIDDEKDSVVSAHSVSDRVYEWVMKSNLQEVTGENKKNTQNNFHDGKLDNGRGEKEKYTELDVTTSPAPELNKAQIAARQFMSKEQVQFSGRPEEWPLFISWWNNSSKVCGFSNNENMLRLQRCLKGKALEAVQFRLLHPDQVEGVIKTLKMLFGRPEIIIQSLLQKVRNEPAPKHDKLETIIHFSLEVDNMCRMMEVTGLSAHLNNPCLLQELVEKLPAQIKLNWGMFKQTISCADLSVFNDWIAKYAAAASEVTVTVPYSFEQKTNKRTKAIINIHQEEKPQDDNKCPACKGDCKSLSSCQKFVQMTLQDKWKLIKTGYICRICLRKHGNRRCMSSQLCGVNGCTYRHNSLLHNSEVQLKVRNNGDVRTNHPTSNNNGVQNTHYSGTIIRPSASLTLFKIVPVKLHYNNKSLDTFAFIDDGSSVTLVDEELAFALGANGETEPLCLRWTANTHRREDSSMKITFEISAQDSNHKYLLPSAHTVKSLDLPRQTLDISSLMQQYAHLKGLPIKSYWNAKPQILLGLQHWRLGMPLKNREGDESQPAAIKTRLGWTLFGVSSVGTELNKEVEAKINIHLCECQNEMDSQMHETVKQYFALESIGTRPTKRRLSDEDYKAMQLLEEKTIFLGDSYAVPLLWKYENIQLPDSKPMAEKRLRCLERRLLQQPQLVERVNKQIEEYLKKGYARKLNDYEVNNSKTRSWYLPIFPVLNPNKPDKLRIVWDAAAKVEGVSLNSCLITGPDDVPSLPSVLFRFREKKIAITGDIREMFHQVKILEDDKNAQRFLWRNIEDGNIEVYQMQVMTFGSTCSPFCAQYIKNKNAKKFEMQFPRATKAIIENHYVDDLLDSVDTEEEAIALVKDVIHIHKHAGFEIRNFVSNSSNVLNALQSKASNANKSFTNYAQNDFEKLLGMWWSPSTDMFVYTFKSSKMQNDVMNGTQIPTKREVLRALMCVFDPLGLIANFTIQLKIILQEIWRSGIGWDEKIKDRQFQKWKIWLSLIPKIKDVSINRRYLTNVHFGTGSRVELHIFVDAGEEAIAAVAYIRVSTQSDVECSLISAKTKVAPIKTLSIPRLELEAAVLGVRLSKIIKNGHTVQFESLTFWTDSQVVLSWIKSSKKYKSFVAVRIGEILESSDASDWNWVCSKDNVADDASRYKSNYDFSSSGRWFTAPEFLYQNPFPPSEKFSEDLTSEKGNEEVKECFLHFEKPSASVLDFNRFSRWKSLLKTQIFIYRYVKLFVLKWRKPCRPSVFQLDEKEAAKILLYKQAQKDSFPIEYEALAIATSSGNEVNIGKTSPLYTLSPYLDENGLIRIAGRIDAIKNVPSETKRPIILPKDHQVTYLIVNEFHIKFCHLFNETVVNELRQYYFIPSLRRVLKKVQRGCQHCKNNRAAPQPPRMAELPPARLQPFQRPFSYTGVDYFGPLFVKIGRRLDKRWGMLLTCLTLRAIHIEIVHSLSSDSCILAFKRFISRRGMPKEVYSDNGTNFRGASKELQQAIRDLNKHAVAKEFELDLKWNFIPPAAPHMGGCWERMVRSVKQTLTEISPIRNPCDELLVSMMAEVESIVNSRPLTYVPIDFESSEALTPNHLLIGCSNQERLHAEPIRDGAAIRRNWIAAEKYAQSFWQRWLREYLPDLTRRTKWFKPQRQLQEGDIVVIVDYNSPRKTWPKGKILKVIPGKDDTVRSAIVQTQTGIYTRPAVKLAVLEVHQFDGSGKLDPNPVTGGEC